MKTQKSSGSLLATLLVILVSSLELLRELIAGARGRLIRAQSRARIKRCSMRRSGNGARTVTEHESAYVASFLEAAQHSSSAETSLQQPASASPKDSLPCLSS